MIFHNPELGYANIILFEGNIMSGGGTGFGEERFAQNASPSYKYHLQNLAEEYFVTFLIIGHRLEVYHKNQKLEF
jgi:hypothetical protein